MRSHSWRWIHSWRSVVSWRSRRAYVWCGCHAVIFLISNPTLKTEATDHSIWEFPQIILINWAYIVHMISSPKMMKLSSHIKIHNYTIYINHMLKFEDQSNNSFLFYRTVEAVTDAVSIHKAHNTAPKVFNANQHSHNYNNRHDHHRSRLAHFKEISHMYDSAFVVSNIYSFCWNVSLQNCFNQHLNISNMNTFSYHYISVYILSMST